MIEQGRWPLGAYRFAGPYSANGLNQYTSAGPTAFAYDPNGNLTSDGATNFVYDIENRLVSASGVKSASLVYDPLGRLWQTSGGSGGGVTQFAYDGDKLLMEFDGAGVILRGYVHGVAQDTPVVWFEGPQPGRILVTDHQGSIVATVKRLGADLAINGYDPWASPMPATRAGSAIPARLGSPSSACGTTRRGSTRRRSGGSCRWIRSDMPKVLICTPM